VLNNNNVFLSPVAKSIPFDNSTNGFLSTNVQAAIEEAQQNALSSVAPIIVTYGGNANIGRYLEIFPATDSLTIPYLIVTSQSLRALSLQCSASTTVTVGVFKTTDLVNPIQSISLSAQIATSITGLSISLSPGDKLALRVTAGSGNKPSIAMYIG
jgi:hypothetical protein